MLALFDSRRIPVNNGGPSKTQDIVFWGFSGTTCTMDINCFSPSNTPLSLSSRSICRVTSSKLPQSVKWFISMKIVSVLFVEVWRCLSLGTQPYTMEECRIQSVLFTRVTKIQEQHPLQKPYCGQHNRVELIIHRTYCQSILFLGTVMKIRKFINFHCIGVEAEISDILKPAQIKPQSSRAAAFNSNVNYLTWPKVTSAITTASVY